MNIHKLAEQMRTNQKQTAMIIVIIALAAVFAYIHLAMRPQAAGIARVYRNITRVRADLKNAKLVIAKTDEMRKAIEAYDRKVGRYEKTLPTEHGLPTLLEDLSEMAKTSNMKISGIVPLAGKEPAARRGQAYQEIPISISARSGYHELGRFLANLENCDRFMKVADISIKANKTSPKKHDVELLILTYVLLGGK